MTSRPTSQSMLLDLDALVDGTRHQPAGAMRPVICAVRFNEARETLAAEISRLTGCGAQAAGRAAGSYLSSPSLPKAELGDWSTGQYAAMVDALVALDEWLALRGLGVVA